MLDFYTSVELRSA